MMKSKPFLGGLVLALMGATALLLVHMKANQQLGLPGVKTQPIAGSKNLEILLPESAPGWTSEVLTNIETALQQLPKDTSFRVRAYKADDGMFVQVTVVLMGSDRSSIHDPKFCLTGQGWAIDSAHAIVDPIPMERPFPYALPVNKLVAAKQFPGPDGRPQEVHGIYIYWYVDDAHITASSKKWMGWWMPRDLLLHGKLERWAYIAIFAPCLPGQEAATYDRVKKLIASTVPEFQLVPKAGG